MPSSNVTRMCCVLLVLGSFTLSGCTTVTRSDNAAAPGKHVTISDPIQFHEIVGLEYDDRVSGKPDDSSLVGDLRIRTVRDTAYAIGAQAGLAFRTHMINQLLETNGNLLERNFNFAPFLIDGKVLCPVVLESERMYQQETETRARTVRVSWAISKTARVVPYAPTWRDYLIRPAHTPVLPNPKLYPRSDDEKREWRQAVKEGWSDGVRQADKINKIDTRRLERDYTGMQRFRMLVNEGVVSMPTLHVGDYGVVKDGKTLHVNDVIHEIEAPAGFNNQQQWTPIFRR